MKRAFKMTAMLLCAVVVMTMGYSCKSNVNPTDKFKKIAAEFKATIDTNTIIAERIDTIVQKVFYLVPDPEGFGDNAIKDIKMHDYATNVDKDLLSETELGAESMQAKLGKEMGLDFHCFNPQYISSELIGDRLFFLVHTDCTFDTETSLIYYIDVLDNSLHYVAECDDATFDKAKGMIAIHKEVLKQAGVEGLEINYDLSTALSDEEYAANRIEKEETERQMADQWRAENLEEVEE